MFELDFLKSCSPATYRDVYMPNLLFQRKHNNIVKNHSKDSKHLYFDRADFENRFQCCTTFTPYLQHHSI